MSNARTHELGRRQLLKALAQKTRDLKASEARFRTIVTSSTNGTVIVDAQGIVQFVNPAAVTILAQPIHKLEGHYFSFPLTDQAQDLHIEHPDGKIVIVEMRTIETTWDGQAAYLVLLQDVSERRTLETAITELNTSLEERVRLRTFELEMLYELSRQLSYTLNYEELIQLMLTHLHRAVVHDVSASIFMMDNVCHLFIQMNAPISPDIQQTIEQRLLKTFLRMRGHQSTTELHRCYTQTLESASFDPNHPVMQRLGSAFQVPIITAQDNEVVGLLFVGAEPENAFTEDQVRLLYTIANQASLSIQRLRILLATEQEHLESLVVNLPEGVVLLDDDHRLILANPSGQRFLSRLRTQTDPVLHDLAGYALERFVEPPPRGSFGHEIILESPQRTVFEVLMQPLSASDTTLTQNWVLMIWDVTEYRRAEEISRLRDRALTASSNGIVIVDATQTDLPIIYVNPAFERITGYLATEVIGRNARFLQHGDRDQPALLELKTALQNGSPCSVILRNYRKDGSRFWNELNVSPIHSTDGTLTHFVGIQTDITERKQTEEQLLHNAFHDVLTNLPNRAFFMKRLEQTIGHCERHEHYVFAVLFIDLDRFKTINDSLGHLVGDQLLMSVAHRLEASLRIGDTVSRLGGDEFALLLEDIAGVQDAIQVANRIHQALSEPLNLNGHEVFTTASIGIALSSSRYRQPEDLLRDADIALYRAKASGKARYEIFDQEMHTRAIELLQLETDLRYAIERQQFLLHYQPIVSLTTGQVTGFEALVRWQHPDKGLVAPSDFILLAEETGWIGKIGGWVLQEACRQLRKWQEQLTCPELSISVNLSGKQFSQPHLVEEIDAILRETGLSPNTLKLEITESAIVDNLESASVMLHQLKTLGIQLYMDDFGTGFSSLSYLHRFPIDVIKIDRSFIHHLANDEDSLEIVRTIIGLAHNLGMTTIAEGIETVEQLYQLQQLQCEAGQGYLFSKPVSAAVAETQLITKHQLAIH